MIPLVVGAIGVGILATEVVAIAATAGTGHALGRKYGRILCKKLDQVESALATSIEKMRK